MTKQGGFKRAVRRQAQKSGKRYTQARADMEREKLNARIWTQVDHEPLRTHLEKQYGISVSALTPFDGDHPGTFRVDRPDGPAWAARVFSSSARKIERIEGDAEILRFFEVHDLPAERCAHAEPVSLLDGRGVFVTEWVEGERAGGDVATFRALGDVLGRLHALPPADGAMARDGGAFDHDPAYEGRPSGDLAAALNFLDVVKDRVAREGRARYDAFRKRIEKADTCDGLPEALTHPNFGPFNTVVTPDGRHVVVGWCGAGRGPRVAALGWLLWCTGGDKDKIAALASAYRAHVRLTGEELHRLPGALLLRQLYLAGWYYWRTAAAGRTPDGIEGWWPDDELTGAIAAEAGKAFAS